MEVMDSGDRFEASQLPKLKKRINILIQRSDGRVHEASVSDIDFEKQCVVVEWVENGETKGKSVDFPFVFHHNPHLLATRQRAEKGNRSEHPEKDARNGSDNHHQRNARRNHHDEEEDDEEEDDDEYDGVMVNIPSTNDDDDYEDIPPPKSSKLPTAGKLPKEPQSIPGTVAKHSKRPTSARLTRPAMTAAHAGRRQLNSVNETAEEQAQKSNSSVQIKSEATNTGREARGLQRANNSGIIPPRAPQQSARERKTEVSPRASVPGNGVARMSVCAREIKKLEQNRNQRRQKLEEAKQKKQELQNMDPGNPNWQFLAMIREYRSTLEFNPLVMTDTAADKQINVCLRKRPLNKKEEAKKDLDIITIPSKDAVVFHECKAKVDLTKYLDNQQFRFDYAFDEEATNEVVYKFTAQPLIQTIFDGGMATCFAYGQTGSGKTHTMGGNFTGKNQDCSTGIYALAARDIFKFMLKPKYKKENLSVRASFFEIYSGKVFDLLNKKKKLRILEDADSQVVVCDLQEKEVKNVEDVLGLLQAGNAVRTSGQTAANQHSSRSHAVFQVILRNKAGNVHGKFSFIDLAGNERGIDTMSNNRQTRLEGAEINKSLLALKECIRALARKGAHLPFRASKLTQVLRDSFIGQNSRTCMIAMISPGMSCSEHTLNTLRYANRVKELDGTGAAGAVEDMGAAARGDDFNPADTISSVASDIASMQMEDNGDDEQNEQLELINALQEAEDEVIDGQRLLLDAFESFHGRLGQISSFTNEPDYDVDEYASQMSHFFEDYAETFMPLMEEFQRKFGVFKKELEKEEEVSKAISCHRK